MILQAYEWLCISYIFIDILFYANDTLGNALWVRSDGFAVQSKLWRGVWPLLAFVEPYANK